MAEAVKLNLAAINAIMTSPGAQAIVDHIGRQMAASAGDGFEYVASPHPFTARGYVQTNSARGRRRQALQAQLERSLGQVKR